MGHSLKWDNRTVSHPASVIKKADLIHHTLHRVMFYFLSQDRCVALKSQPSLIIGRNFRSYEQNKSITLSWLSQTFVGDVKLALCSLLLIPLFALLKPNTRMNIDILPDRKIIQVSSIKVQNLNDHIVCCPLFMEGKFKLLGLKPLLESRPHCPCLGNFHI